MIGDRGTVADIMAGTGTVALELKKQGYSVIASDVMTYSYHHLITNLQLANYPSFKGVEDRINKENDCCPYINVLNYLNNLKQKNGFLQRILPFRKSD